ncbi:hypothetical protein H920_02494 [Fukomys damarensis]|uniref:Uncharacterized protein n=1 Tax=Fukomys damarensis TaxID=885580 RepID=A0A091E0P2_FUKDA|nr:hypothetical protein H920_02494 [Fukomys damarensis]
MATRQVTCQHEHGREQADHSDDEQALERRQLWAGDVAHGTKQTNKRKPRIRLSHTTLCLLETLGSHSHEQYQDSLESSGNEMSADQLSFAVLLSELSITLGETGRLYNPH